MKAQVKAYMGMTAMMKVAWLLLALVADRKMRLFMHIIIGRLLGQQEVLELKLARLGKI